MADETKKELTMEEFQALVDGQVEKTIRSMGLDSVDRKHGIFPTKEDPNGDKLQEVSKEERVKQFMRAVVDGDHQSAKALSEGTAADGGYLVPTDFRLAVQTKRDLVSVIRPRATVFPMGTDKMTVPTDGSSVTLYWKAENTILTESNPTFGGVTLDTNKLTGLSKMSRELFADSAINLMDFLANIYGRAFAKEEDKKFMTGSGTGEPKGLRTYAITSIAQAAATHAADDVLKLYYALPSQYRANATWILNNGTTQVVRLLKDTTGKYIWADGFNNAPATLLGRPVIEQPDIPSNLGAGTNESEIYFGDLSYYLIGDRQEMTIESTTQGAGAFEYHQVAVKAIERVDGQLGLTDGFVKMTAVK